MTRKTETKERYQPVAFDPKAYAAKKRQADPAFKAAYDALEDEFAALASCNATPMPVEKLVIQMT
jgi:hypothetical protein